MKLKNIFWAATLSLLAGVLATGCSHSRKAVTPPVPVLVAKVMVTNLPVRLEPEPVGHVMSISTVTIHSQIQGMISAVHFKEGQEVKKGDLLFSIDPRPSQAALDQARAALERDAAQLEYSTINFAREQKLFDQKLISQDELDTNRASRDALTGTVAADRAAITNALLNLDYCEIRAPVDGRTGSLQTFVGNVVKAPDDVLLMINQIHPIYVAVSVPEEYLPQIKKQMRAQPLPVTVDYENMQGAPPAGELTFIDNSVDETTGTIQLRATFPNTDRTLWPGQFVKVAITLAELTNAIVVPAQAVQTGQNGPFIYVLKENPTNAAVSVVENRPVTTGITYENFTVVQKGLSVGETVVTDGQLRLAPGVKVSVKTSLTPGGKNSATNAPATNAMNAP